MATNPIERSIAPRLDRREAIEWRTQMSTPNNCGRDKHGVRQNYPIVFVPGVMGSNLRGIGQIAGVETTSLGYKK